MSQAVETKRCLFTVGHSDHEMAEFIALLTRHEIDAVADVRSQPYSRFHSQFNRETLAESLKRAGIQYAFLGKELGARRAEPESYRDRQARYDLIAGLPAFREGIERIRRGLTTHRIALLCAEKDPLTCHRTVLVCRHLRSEPISIEHILEDGSIETTEAAEARLLELVGLPPAHLFKNRQELIEEAYDMQGERIAYTESDPPSATSGGPA